jgi:hypothetical protein
MARLNQAGHDVLDDALMQYVIGAILALGLCFLLWRQAKHAQQMAFTSRQAMFRDVLPLLENTTSEPGEAVGSWKVSGRYSDRLLQFQIVVDTLATRKLPSLWLMITLPETQPVSATFDLMMRPTGPATFSGFDFLPVTMVKPVGFPEYAVIRTDNESAPYPADEVRPHLIEFIADRGKELLISPKGLRVVLQLAESDRARYGVFREANFGDVVIDADLARRCMEMLIAIAGRLTDHG